MRRHLVGILYLENSLAPRVFTPKRLAVLEMLASQAAVSLDHARLYADLNRLNAEPPLVVRQARRLTAMKSLSLRVDSQLMSIAGSARRDTESSRLY